MKRPKLSIVQLPTASQENQTNIMSMLEKIARDVADGKINALIAITGTVDNRWRSQWAGLAEVDRVLGQVRLMSDELSERFRHG